MGFFLGLDILGDFKGVCFLGYDTRILNQFGFMFFFILCFFFFFLLFCYKELRSFELFTYAFCGLLFALFC